MKISFLTFADSYNYGASLQAYATYIVLTKYGYEVNLINYRNSAEAKKYSCISINKNLKLSMNIKNIIKNSILLGSINGKKAFSKFNKIIPRTSKYDKDSIIDFDNKETCEYVVIGSDQVWNPGICGGKYDYNFFGKFTNKKIITFSSSCGSYTIDDNEIEEVKILLNKMKKISVRERFLKNQLIAIGIKEISILIDPTLIISRDEWKNITKDKCSIKKIKESYLLIYLVSTKYNDCLNYIKYITKIYNLKVVYINLYNIKKKMVDYHLQHITPYEFVELIDNASMILTDSFHGVAFATNFNKQFFAIPNKNPKRIEDYLNEISCDNRIIYNFSVLEKECNRPINYEVVNKYLEQGREDARRFILDAFD